METISVLDNVLKPGIISVDCGIGCFQHELVSPDESCVLDLASPLYAPSSRTKIYDRSGKGNHGTITGALWKRNNQGLWYLDFDGLDDYVTLTHGGGLAFYAGDVSAHLWVRAKTTLVGYEGLIGSAAGGGFGLYGSGGAGTVSVTKVGIVDATASTITIPTTSFVCLDVTFDTSETTNNLLYYLNGALNDTVNWDIDFNDGSWTDLLGCRLVGSHNADVLMLLVSMHNAVRSATEIRNRFNQERHLFGV